MWSIITKMKKGQTEIVGLVIIVILIVFIAIFSLTFILKSEQQDDDILKLKANALRSSLLKTNVCGSVTVKDEIENCIDDYYECIDCGNLQSEIVKIISGSLENEEYNFNVFSDGESFMRIGSCVDNVTAVNQNIRNGVVEVTLCRQ